MIIASAGRDNDWWKVAFGYAPTLKLPIAENQYSSVRCCLDRVVITSGPLWVSRMGKEDSALSRVTVRNNGA